MSDDSDAAMKAVLDDMGRHARQAKAKRYAPKPVPAPAAPAVDPHNMTTGELTDVEFEQLLNQQRNSKDESLKDLDVQR